jgi:ribose-phosphate pyrophosphokinase
MNGPVLLSLPGNEPLASLLSSKLSWKSAAIELRRFPDGESHVRIPENLDQRAAAILCTLDRPDEKLLPLLFAADASRDLGATSVGLVAPYLAYMRQDRRFETGEAISSRTFARVLSSTFDWLVTVDPHLHRYGSLAQLFSIPATIVHAAPLLAEWVKSHVVDPVLIGPDSESTQWVSEAAARIGAPFTVLEKTRKGDRAIEIRVRSGPDFTGKTPVLLDDIISTGETMRVAAQALRSLCAAQPVLLAVHGIFAPGADTALAETKARVVTCNTVSHPTNAIDVSELLAHAIHSAHTANA